jgi:hypothetical protein
MHLTEPFEQCALRRVHAALVTVHGKRGTRGIDAAAVLPRFAGRLAAGWHKFRSAVLIGERDNTAAAAPLVG